MDLLSLLRKEAIEVRRNLVLFLLLLVVVPGCFAVGTAVYQQTLPEDIPIGVVGANENATEDDLTIIRGGVAFFASPTVYDTPEAAQRALYREEVYFVIEVPPDITDETATANFTAVSDQANVPFQDPANITARNMDSNLDRNLPATVTVTHERKNPQYTLSEFLSPTMLLAFVLFYALAVVPYDLQREREVLDRLQTESSLDTVVASKLLFYGIGLLVPLAVFQVTSWQLGYRLNHFDPLTIGILMLTFCYLAAIGLAVLFIFRLRQAGLFVNLALIFGSFALSSLIYPVGFFSTIRKTIARTLPTHYSMIIIRGSMLRDVSPSLYSDWILNLIGFAIASLIALKLAIVYYERTR